MASLEYEKDYLSKNYPPQEAEEPVREEMQSKRVLAETVDRLKNFLDWTQAKADKHRKLAEYYQNEHDDVHNFLANNFWDNRKQDAEAKLMRKEPF